MTTAGELLLLSAFVAIGYAAFASLATELCGHRTLARSADIASIGGLVALSGVTAVLGWALAAKDFRFAYVAQYSSQLLPWRYSLSALWVGQAGSLLLWSWFVGLCWLLCRFGAGCARVSCGGLLAASCWRS
jgi:cytochrome c-type biogenesis protein CcmF